jgi:molybdopterin molybdotransferase
MTHSLDDTLALVRRTCQPLPPTRVPLAQALGRVLREPLRATEDLPPFDRSAMDGYAVRPDESSRSLVLVDELRAGDWKPRELAPGQAVRIATGAALPNADLRVVPQEDVTRSGDSIQLHQPPEEGWIRRRGEDARQGDILLNPGIRLTPGHLTLCAALGQTTLATTRLPRIVHLTTGNELVPPEATPTRGQIRDSNSILIRALLAAWGFPVEQRTAGEDLDCTRAALAELDPSSIDLLLISGGSSVGDHDVTGPLLEALGYTILVRKTNVRPGRPLLFAAREGGVAFGLPGNPVSHFVCCHLYVAAALHRLSGQAPSDLFVQAGLTRSLDHEPHSRESLLPARLSWEQDRLMTEPIDWRSSGDVTALARVEALLRLPPGVGTLPTGARVDVLPFVWPGPDCGTRVS